MTTNWTLVRTTSPTSLPVTLNEVKSHLRLSLSDTTHDANLTLLMTAATERLEHDIDRQLMSASYRQSQFNWDSGGEVKLYRKQITAITSVNYVDENGVSTLLDPADYVFDAGRGSIFPAPDGQYPAVQDNNPNAVLVEFTAGYGTDPDCIPPIMKAAILLTVGKWFFDPAQEGSALHSQEVAYGHLIRLLHRSTYP